MSDRVVLVTGGAGYIGSHMVKLLRRSGYLPVALDNLSSGKPEALLGSELVVGDIGDSRLVDNILSDWKPLAVMHFAGSIEVAESIKDPGKYYRNNVASTQTLLDCMLAHSVNILVFSSTAAIFGSPAYVPIDESHPTHPINPYGRSKLMVEQILADYDAAHGFRSVCFRYFNAAGADPEGELGESHDPETHLIPIVLQSASGRRPRLVINGNDYPTPDGTCIRDFVHVEDLCNAHLIALSQLLGGGKSARYNLGNGSGFSVLQVIECAQRITGRNIQYAFGPRRDGDPAVLFADASLARHSLSWTPKYQKLEDIIAHAWQWEQKLASNNAR